MRTSFLLFFAMLVWGGEVFAGETAGLSGSVKAADSVLIVGVEDYAFLPDIAGVREVSGAWEDFFKQQLGAANVVTLVDAQAVREEILDAAERTGGMASGGRVWVVYVGHGANVGSGAMLLGADTQQTSRSVTTRGVTQDEVLAAIRSRTEAEVWLGRRRTGFVRRILR